MTKHKYLCLLRGINVGGHNIIKMVDLKVCFESMGLQDVKTYIQSGNVIFSASESKATLLKKIESVLSKTFKYESKIVLTTLEEVEAVVKKAPKGFGTDAEQYRYDVMFIKEPMTPKEAASALNPKEGVDAIAIGPGVIYFSRLISKATQSRMAKIVAMPVYKSMTIRNWNTTTKLLALLST